MTINQEDSPQPQAQGQGQTRDDPPNGLKALVHTLVERAVAADQRSAELVERVAMLEGRRQAPAPKDEERPLARVRIGVTRVSFSRSKRFSQLSSNVSSRSNNIQNAEAGALPVVEDDEGRLSAVVGVPEDDPGEALADRILLIERRLETCEEERDVLDERNYELPESTFTFLITHNPLSLPFVFAVFTISLSIGCLALTLTSSIPQDVVEDNRLGVPAGVDDSVRVAQFLGVIIGVVMEDEIPQGLQLIANGAGHTLLLNGQNAVQKRVVASSVFRLVVGYLFLSSLLIHLAQNNDVISIFYDVLALEFVENIDDTTFALAKRGFFGRVMLVAANQKYNLEIFSGRRRSVMMRRSGTGSSTDSSIGSMAERRLSLTGLIASNNRVNSVVRFIYFLNAAIVLAGLGYITAMQRSGLYRCNTINVKFDEVIWENANVILPDVGTEERLLIYPAFNGIYQAQGTYKGYPKYIEQNKNDGSEFGPSVTGAMIIYCHKIGSWIFMHPKISINNECSWLWRSPKTQDYDILRTAFDAWEAWTGQVKLAHVTIACKECSELSDCNYHGTCVDKVCDCDAEHFGDSCEFDLPCKSLVSEKVQQLDPINGAQWELKNPIRQWGNNPADPAKFYRVYNRPVYIQMGLSGEPYDMRLYKIREKKRSSSPSSQPSTEGQNAFGGNYFDENVGQLPTLPPTKPLHSQNEYDIAPDFADWDDFFESPYLHDLEDILEEYSVIISYSGSRFYGTIIEPNATLEELFPSDYHAFWTKLFDVNRTFIISDTTFGGSPVGIDFFEMRRRVDSMLRNRNVHFEYGPYGALIPLMDYEDTGFFHCLEETFHPSSSPSSSLIASPSPSLTTVPTTTLFPSNFRSPLPP